MILHIYVDQIMMILVFAFIVLELSCFNALPWQLLNGYIANFGDKKYPITHTHIKGIRLLKTIFLLTLFIFHIGRVIVKGKQFPW